VLGNQVFADEYPGLQIIALERTREELASDPLAGRVRSFGRERGARRAAGAEEIARLQRRGLVGDDAVVSYLRRYYDRDIDAIAEAYAGARVTPPTATFAGRRLLLRGERRIELLELHSGEGGPGTIVYLPNERLVIAGDAVTHPVPYGFAPSQTEWLETLKRVAELGFDDLVPGHGDVLVDRAYVDLVIALVEFEIDQVAGAIRRGYDADSASWQINFERWAERFVGHDAVGRYRFQTWFVEPAVARAHAELSGGR
jgi:glyoxylase-like metal-dependent hydrolase (beta-lactamase superfamily II)